MDSSLHFQNQMQSVFADELYESVIIWIDDLVLYAMSDDEYLDKLQMFFTKLRTYNIKISALKSTLYAKQVAWCDHVIDSDGVKHDAARVDALVALPLPTAAGELQSFLCAAVTSLIASLIVT